MQQHGQGIPAGSNRSAVQHMRFAMASAATQIAPPQKAMLTIIALAFLFWCWLFFTQ
jgi:hypothetical protein